MDEYDYFCSFKESFFSFKKNLEDSIKNDKISLNNTECYLITDIWEKNLTNNFTKIENNIKIYQNKIHFYNENFSFMPKDVPEFVNQSNVIFYLNKGYKLKLIDKELMEKRYDKNSLRKNSTVNYFSGNNLLIIEFMKVYKEKYDINSLLIINASESININNSLIISFKVSKEEKQKIYKELLSNKYNLQISNDNKIINYEEVLNLQKLSSFYKFINNYGIKKIIKQDILKILFYIYYLEEFLLTNNDLKQIFNDYQNYYLINSNWMKELKEFYDYQKICNFIKQNQKAKNFKTNYGLLDGQIKMILKSFLDKYSDSVNSEFPENLKNNKEIKSDETFSLKYIIPEKILDMIKKDIFNNKLYIKPYKINVRKNDLFINDNSLSLLIIGNLNEKLLFIPKFKLKYNKLNYLHSDKEFFKSNSFEEYLKSKECKTGDKENEIFIYNNNLILLKNI